MKSSEGYREQQTLVTAATDLWLQQLGGRPRRIVRVHVAFVKAKCLRDVQLREHSCSNHCVEHNGGDGEVFQNGHLLTDYADLNGDGIADVRLHGEVEKVSADGTLLLSKRPCEKAFLWNATSGKFEEDRSRRIGISDDHD